MKPFDTLRLTAFETVSSAPAHLSGKFQCMPHNFQVRVFLLSEK